MRPRLEADAEVIRIVDSEPASRFVAYAPEPGLPLSIADWRKLRECMAAGPELADLIELIERTLREANPPIRALDQLDLIFHDPAVMALLHRIK